MSKVQVLHLISIRTELKGLEKSIHCSHRSLKGDFKNEINILMFSFFSMSEIFLTHQDASVSQFAARVLS